MIRTIDWLCSCCGVEIIDALADEQEEKRCLQCHTPMEQVWWRTRMRAGEWDDASAVLVFRDKDGNVRYPGRVDAPCPSGFEPVRLRNLHAVEKFEREHNVRSEMAWFDKGSGRGHDDYYRGEKVTH